MVPVYDEHFEHTRAILGQDIAREASARMFLEGILQSHADHVWPEIKRKLDEEYPRATHVGVEW